MIGLIPIGDAFCAAAACAICCRYSAAILLRCWLISINCGELFITSGENGNGCCINNWFCPTRGNPGFKGHCGVVGVIAKNSNFQNHIVWIIFNKLYLCKWIMNKRINEKNHILFNFDFHLIDSLKHN